jgi:hypothetical protein
MANKTTINPIVNPNIILCCHQSSQTVF